MKPNVPSLQRKEERGFGGKEGKSKEGEDDDDCDLPKPFPAVSQHAIERYKRLYWAEDAPPPLRPPGSRLPFERNAADRARRDVLIAQANEARLQGKAERTEDILAKSNARWDARRAAQRTDEPQLK